MRKQAANILLSERATQKKVTDNKRLIKTNIQLKIP